MTVSEDHPASRSSLPSGLGRLSCAALLALGLYAVTPRFLLVHARTQVFGPPTHVATITSMVDSRVVHIARVLADGERPGPGERESTQQRGTDRGTITERTAIRTLTSERSDGSSAPWPTFVLADGERELTRTEGLRIVVSCPSLGDEPLEWAPDGPPSDWMPGTACTIVETVKGHRIEPGGAR